MLYKSPDFYHRVVKGVLIENFFLSLELTRQIYVSFFCHASDKVKKIYLFRPISQHISEKLDRLAKVFIRSTFHYPDELKF